MMLQVANFFADATNKVRRSLCYRVRYPDRTFIQIIHYLEDRDMEKAIELMVISVGVLFCVMNIPPDITPGFVFSRCIHFRHDGESQEAHGGDGLHDGVVARSRRLLFTCMSHDSVPSLENPNFSQEYFPTSRGGKQRFETRCKLP
jgi:hypothetical protein